MKRIERLTLAVAALLASVPLASAQDAVRYVHLDALGSVRAVSNEANVVIERHDYLPFGEECTTGPCASNPGVGAGQPRKFTGKERDQETGLDYFGARYYSSKVGRFTTVDPAYIISGNLVDPQLWNRYSYVRNNPLRHTDPDGRLIDILLDIAAIEYDLLDIGVTLYTGGELTATHFKALGGDVLGAAVPFLTGVGAGIRTANKVDNAVDLGKATKLPDDALVVRGGQNRPADLARATGTHPSGVTGVSVESAPGKTLEELSQNIPHGQVGCCTVGDVRKAGGDVIPTKGRSPNHATMTGVSPEKGSELLTPTIPNPAKAKDP